MTQTTQISDKLFLKFPNFHSKLVSCVFQSVSECWLNCTVESIKNSGNMSEGISVANRNSAQKIAIVENPSGDGKSVGET